LILNNFQKWGLWAVIVLVMASAAWADDAREQSQYFLIVNLYNQDAYDLTAEQIAQFKTEFPSSSLLDRIEFIEARAQQEKNQFSEAQALYENFLKKYPQSRLRDKALFFLGEVDFRKGDFSNALIVLQRLQRDYPQSSFWPDALYWIAETLFVQGKIPEAQQTFERYLTEFPGGKYREEARYSRAWCAFKAGRFTEAASLFAAWGADYPRAKLVAQARFYQGLSLYKDGKTAEAQKLFSALIAQEAGTSLWPRALFYQAECAYKLGDPSLAEKGYGDVLAVEKQGSLAESALYGLGFSQAAQSHFVDALKTLDQFILTFPDSALKRSVLYKKALLLEQTGDLANAEKGYLELIPTSEGKTGFREEAQLGLVRLAFLQKNWAKVLQYGNGTLNQYPQGAYRNEALLTLGEAFFQQKQVPEARGFFQRVVDEFPQGGSTLEAWYKLGLCENMAGNTAKAKDAFEIALNRFAENPHRAETLFALAELSLKLGATADAINYYGTLLESPSLPDLLKEKALYGLGWAAFKKPDYLKSLEAFNQLQKSFPASTWNTTITFKKGEAYWNLKQFANAEKEFSMLVPSSSLAADARYYMAQIYGKTGEFAKAVKSFQLLADQTSDPRLRVKAWMEIGWNSYRLENYQDAYLYFAKVIEKAGSANVELLPEATLRQADCLYNLRRFQEAADRYQQAFQVPNTRFAKDALYGSFLSVLELNNFVRAKEIWKQFSLLYPQDPLALEMDQKMGERQSQ
jgi:TolA-binding protein